jgi:hypothetical protein
MSWAFIWEKILEDRRARNMQRQLENARLTVENCRIERAPASAEVEFELAALRAERDQLAEALGMADHQQHEVARALGLELACDSVFRHYAILETIAVMKRRDPSAGTAPDPDPGRPVKPHRSGGGTPRVQCVLTECAHPGKCAAACFAHEQPTGYV